jgi:hypothetical protein
LVIDLRSDGADEEYCDDFSDDVIEEPKRKKFVSILAASVLVLSSSFFLQSTLAGKINIGSSGSVEFGQGTNLTTACSGSSVLKVTPTGSFANASSAGSFYLASVTVSGIPINCYGSDFNISVYDSTTSTALPIFNSNSTVATIYDNAGAFEVGHGGSGSTVTSGSGSFTVTFGAPVALASSVAKIAIQSTAHVAATCIDDGICVVGQIGGGPGGGTIFYYNAAGFAETGTACNLNCHYLEWNQTAGTLTNQNVGIDSFLRWSSDTSHLAGTSSQAIGMGFTNTQKMLSNNGATGYTADTSGAAYGSSIYAGTDNSAGKWFLPSYLELQLMGQSGYASAGGLTGNYYWSSTEDAGNAGNGIGQVWPNSGSISWTKSANFYIRYVRAF